jgi:hypothetical protein
VLGYVEPKENIVYSNDQLVFCSLRQTTSNVPATTGQVQDWFLRLVNETGKGERYQVAWLTKTEGKIVEG